MLYVSPLACLTTILLGLADAIAAAPTTNPSKASRALNGLDSLLSIVQMPGGVPVLTVAINGAKNAALSAIAILATNDEALSKKYEEFRQNQTDTVLKIEL